MNILKSLFGPKQVIGLDIGASYVKAMELKSIKNHKFELQSFNYAPTPPGTIEYGNLIDPKPLIPVISELIQKMHSKTKQICISLCGKDIIVKQISLPYLEDMKDISHIVRDEAEQYIPHDLTNAHLQYHILGNNQAKNQDWIKLLIISAQKDNIFSFLELIQLLEMECSIIDITSFALSNCFVNNYPQATEDTIALLNLGSEISNFVVLENKETVFAKDLFVGGDLYNDNLISQMQVSKEEAESLKISASKDQATPSEISQIIQKTHQAIAEDIQKNFDFYHAKSDKLKIQKLFITGGSSLTKDIASFLKTSLNIDVQVINPFSTVVYNESKFSPEYISQITPYATIAMGLSMRYRGDNK